MLTRNALVTVTVAGVNYGTWITKSGGQTSAEDQKIRLGGMSPQVALGGPAETENVVAGRLFDVYMQTKVKVLRPLVGRASATLTHTPLSAPGTPSGPSETYSGVLTRVTPPEADDNSSEPAMIEIEISTNESVA